MEGIQNILSCLKESDESKRAKLRALNVLDIMVKLAMQQIFGILSEEGSRLHIYGSWKLGVSVDSDDIDLFVLAPFSTEFYFGRFVEQLENNPDITLVDDLSNAPVPRLNIYVGNVKMECLHLDFNEIPTEIRLT